ncbi:phenylalanine--tRNA ligase subunit beta [Chitinasiproducens palmae]|uniref:Phenylalanine--tRNA ligase beta subunit n=1 Tax=Chitinasiproducens palmae TaxID=1770053 RepID=A0A1H2PSY5_9BURK|nr:phenylalanine--tRNA ligase subunit beta [Chitinasiproducens palmae]SDV50173.1 phenylalanyl-tRNA synthetase beta subunit [Chitinasiproducens palmae]
MQFSESWLRSFVNPALDTEALAHAMTMGGAEVESLRPSAPPCSGVVVARVVDVSKHPDADRLNVCQVDVGGERLLNIVCGAPNVAPGVRVPCALVGAELPPAEAGGEPFRIRKGKLRGVESEGMLCSARELKLSEDHGGLLLLPADAPVGQDIRDYLGMDDTIFEVKLTPNKADCLSVMGLARDVAAITGAAFEAPAVAPVAPSLDERLPVRIAAPDLCGRFSGRIVRNVNARAATPAWMVSRLASAGQRSVSALVDISNYVMLALGRPSHVFDLDKISGGLEVRWARDGESLQLLNGQTVTLASDVGVIADQHSVESLAGIMGGDSTAVSLDTRNVYIEAAFWWPDAIRGRARRYNFSTDAAYRFERGVDYATTVEHVELLTRLLIDICGGDAGPVDDQVVALPARQPVTLRVARLVKVLGVTIAADEIADILTRLNLPFDRQEDRFVVRPPSYRFDLEIEEDLIEEVARIYGYDRIPVRPPVAPSSMRGLPETQRGLHGVRRRIAARDYVETVNFSFVDADYERDLAGNATPLRLLNPIASQLSVMRSTLLGGLIDVLRYNLNRKADRVRVFEAGRVFGAQSAAEAGPLAVRGIAQPLRVAALAYGPADEEQWAQATRPVDFFDVKGDLEALLAPRVARFDKTSHPALHPGRAASVWLDGVEVGFIGELHPRWQQKYELPRAPIVFEIDLAAASLRALPAPSLVSRFPPVRRDIALVVRDEVGAQAVLDSLLAGAAEPACKAVRQIVLFDQYKPREEGAGGLAAGDKSLAFRITLQDTESTLNDQDIDLAMDALVGRVAREHGARLRS